MMRSLIYGSIRGSLRCWTLTTHAARSLPLLLQVSKLSSHTQSTQHNSQLSRHAQVTEHGAQLTLTPHFLQNRYPEPPAGKLTLIRKGDVSTVKPVELYGQLKYMSSEDVLETFRASYMWMDKTHYALSLRRLEALRNSIRKAERDNYVDGIFQDERFQVLVAMVTRKGHHYNADVQFHIIHQLHGFEFPDSHPAMIVYLRLLRHNISRLVLDQLVNLSQLVRQLEVTADTRAILQAIPELIPTRLDELKYLDALEAATFLTYYADLLSPFHRDVLLYTVDNEVNGEWIPAHQASQLFWVFCGDPSLRWSLPDPDLAKHVLHICHRHRDMYDPEDLSMILRSMISMVYITGSRADMRYVYMLDDFLDSLVEKSAEKDVSSTVNNLLPILQLLCKVSHYHEPLFILCEDLIRVDVISDSDLLEFLVCCWSMNYELRKKDLATQGVERLTNSLTFSRQTLSLDDFLKTSILLASTNIQLPESLAADLVLPPDGETDHQHDHVTWDDAADTGSRQGTLQWWLRQLNVWTCGLPYEEIQILVKHLWGYLPPMLQDISIERKEELKKSHLNQLDIYLTDAVPEYTIDTSHTTQTGLTLDYLLTSRTDASDRIAVKWFNRHGRVSIENRPHVKKLAEVYFSCLQSEGYKCIAVNAAPTWEDATWRRIPHSERTSYLRHKIQALANSSDSFDIL